jgi:hypothetical protein
MRRNGPLGQCWADCSVQGPLFAATLAYKKMQVRGNRSRCVGIVRPFLRPQPHMPIPGEARMFSSTAMENLRSMSWMLGE